MAKSLKKSRVVLVLVFLSLFFVVNAAVVVVLMPTQSEKFFCTDTVPKIEIDLSEITLEELNTGSKEDKYPDNMAKISTCSGVLSTESVEIKGRGNSTWGQPKNPYQIKFDSKIDLFGMGKAKKWVLLANYFDDSNLRTDVAFYLESLLGEQYALQGEFVELSIDGEDLGLYYLTPKVEIEKSRVDLKDPMGILVELDNLHKNEDHFLVDTNYFQVKDLVADDNEEAAVADFKRSLKMVMKAARQKNLKELGKFVDLESLVRYYLLSEFTVNPDAYTSSFFMYKDGPEDKIHFGPGWDFDFGLGNRKWVWAKNEDFYSPYQMGILDLYNPELYDNVIWLVDNEEFHEMVSVMYREKLLGRKDEVLSYLEKQASYIWGAASQDAAKWECNFTDEYHTLYEWLSGRFDYFDEVYGGLGELDKHML